MDVDIVLILLGFKSKLFKCNANIKVWVKLNSGMIEKLINMKTTFDELGG